MKKNKVFHFLLKKQYVLAGVLVIAAAFGMTELYSYNQKQEEKRLEQELAEQEADSELTENQEKVQLENASSVVPPKEEIEEEITSNQNGLLVDEAAFEIADSGETPQDLLLEEAKETADADTAQENTKQENAKNVSVTAPSLHFPAEEGLLWPIDGNVIMNYSMDATIYYPTLDQYKYNPAIIIAGEVNDKVYAVAQGKIADISQNEVTGTTVTVDLGDGYQAIYGQLKELNFKVGEYVESGHVLGYVSEPTKYYSLEGSNLYFELQKDGVPVDPISYFE